MSKLRRDTIPAHLLPYMVDIPSDRLHRGRRVGLDLDTEIAEWCRSSCKGQWQPFLANGYLFELKKDAALFKLFWR